MQNYMYVCMYIHEILSRGKERTVDMSLVEMYLELSHLAVEGDGGFLGVPGTAEVSLHRQLDVERLEQHPLTDYPVISCNIQQDSGGEVKYMVIPLNIQ